MENNIIQELNNLRSIVKKADTVTDLYISFKNYRNYVLENWPVGMIDRKGWKIEMEFTLEKLESKKNVKNIKKSKDLPSFITDANSVMHHFNIEIEMYLSNPNLN